MPTLIFNMAAANDFEVKIRQVLYNPTITKDTKDKELFNINPAIFINRHCLLKSFGKKVLSIEMNSFNTLKSQLKKDNRTYGHGKVRIFYALQDT